MDDARRARLRAQLRNAERRLEAIEAGQINVAASQYGGGFDSSPEDRQYVRRLNERMADAAGAEDLRAEIVRLREELGEDHPPRRSIVERLRALLG